MAITDMYRVVQVMTGVAGSPWYYTGYFDALTGTAQQAAEAWRTFIGTNPESYGTPLRADSIVTVDRVEPVNGDIIATENVSVGSLQYVSTAENLPPATALMVGWRTGVYRGGREVRGRTYISRLAEALSDNGVPQSGTLTTYQGRGQALFGGETVQLVVWSRKSGEHFPVTSCYVKNQWAVLRSRRD